MTESAAYRIEPLTPERWGDLERLFGPRRGLLSIERDAYARALDVFEATGPLTRRGRPRTWSSRRPQAEAARRARDQRSCENTRTL